MRAPTPRWNDRRVAILVADLRGRGVQKASLNLLLELHRQGFECDLVLAQAEGEYLDRVPAGVLVHDLGAPRALKAIPALVTYLADRKPWAMISAEDNTNVVALLARQIAGFPKVISVSSHVMPSLWVKRWNPLRKVFWLGLAVRTTYPLATARVAVSTSIAEEMSELLGLARESISVIHNPVTTPELAGSTEEEPAHPWLRQGDPPVVIGMGSLTPIKGFDVLLRAFADLRKTTGARLIVLGQGPQLGALIRLSQELGISEEVAFPGFVSSPQSYLREAGLFVLSSRSEGLPLVLVEAMACGCPVVSTDCSSGPVEILEGGRYGPLVPVDDTEALVEAMQARLAAPRDADGLRRGAERFRVDTILSEYRKILEF